MIREIVFIFLTIGCAGAQTPRSNPRPVERPSRTVEGLLKRQEEAAKAAESTLEDGGKGQTKQGQGAAKEKDSLMVFRIGGGEAWEAARRAGWKFFPKGARGGLDGVSTIAEIQPGVWYSRVEGPVLTQRRTLAGWGRISENTFFMFADAQGRPRSLAKGWTVQDIRLNGDAFRWVVRPEAGGTTPSMAIQLAGGKTARDSEVRLESLVLQGPSDAKDWRQAFAGK